MLPRTLEELLRRTQPGLTARMYEQVGREDGVRQHSQAEQLPNQQWPALYLWLQALQASLDDRLDGGPVSPRLDRIEATWLAPPGTTARQTAGDAAWNRKGILTSSASTSPAPAWLNEQDSPVSPSFSARRASRGSVPTPNAWWQTSPNPPRATPATDARSRRNHRRLGGPSPGHRVAAVSTSTASHRSL